jgi:hypothetical protein
VLFQQVFAVAGRSLRDVELGERTPTTNSARSCSENMAFDEPPSPADESDRATPRDACEGTVGCERHTNKRPRLASGRVGHGQIDGLTSHPVNSGQAAAPSCVLLSSKVSVRTSAALTISSENIPASCFSPSGSSSVAPAQTPEREENGIEEATLDATTPRYLPVIVSASDGALVVSSQTAVHSTDTEAYQYTAFTAVLAQRTQARLPYSEIPSTLPFAEFATRSQIPAR